MIYDSSSPTEAGKALDYLLTLTKRGNVIEVKKVNPKRSTQQNSYLHLLLGLYAMETGHRLEEAKVIYKRYANPELFVYKKDNMYFLRSSADLDVAEMTKSIDRFREFAAEQNIDLPSAMTPEEMRSIANRMEEQQQYL